MPVKYKYSIIIEKGFCMKYFGCNYLEHGLSFERNRVDDCCIIHHDKLGMPNLIENYNGEPIDWEHIFKLKREKIERQKKIYS